MGIVFSCRVDYSYFPIVAEPRYQLLLFSGIVSNFLKNCIQLFKSKIANPFCVFCSALLNLPSMKIKIELSNK